jgi:hypothetical protein
MHTAVDSEARLLLYRAPCVEHHILAAVDLAGHIRPLHRGNTDAVEAARLL